MSSSLPFSQKLLEVSDALYVFEASESVANTGTGSRREGEQFEHLLGEFWAEVRAVAVQMGASATPLVGNGAKNYVVLKLADRELVIPAHKSDLTGYREHLASRWLAVVFKVDDMVNGFPGRPAAVANYAPSIGPFRGGLYGDMFSDLKTQFDDTVVMIDKGVLVEKVLLEYKTAKSSRGRQLDGNAHERLSFQVMQYLEIATRYTKCSLMVISNGAFSRYRNKYHVNFHVQADRLSNFAWFQMDHASEPAQYIAFAKRLIDWLKG